MERLAIVHLNYAVQSEYVRISDTSSSLSKLVFGQTKAANLHVSPDCLTFTYLTTTVHLPDLRHGLQKAVIELKRLFNVLRMGIDCSYVPPPVWRDNWRTTAVGDSFLAQNKLFDGDPHPWLTGLLNSTEFKLFQFRTDGILRYDRNGRPLLDNELLNQIFANDKAFLHHLMIVCFKTSSGDRGTQFMEYRRVNGPRPRSVLISWDGQLTLASRRQKPEIRTEKECFIPSLVPPEVAEIMKDYLILIRPGENFHGGSASVLTHLFLFIKSLIFCFGSAQRMGQRLFVRPNFCGRLKGNIPMQMSLRLCLKNSHSTILGCKLTAAHGVSLSPR